MNPSMHAQEPGAITTYLEANVTEMDLLAQWGFSAEEITSLLRLRQWYQMVEAIALPSYATLSSCDCWSEVESSSCSREQGSNAARISRQVKAGSEKRALLFSHQPVIWKTVSVRFAGRSRSIAGLSREHHLLRTLELFHCGRDQSR